VTGDDATALEMIDFDDDGEPELLTGSADFAIRVFKGEELIYDVNETSKISFLSKIKKACFA
jgi:hypothetical protein